MDAATRRRLAKLLARTNSPHEGEVLVAARKANELLAKLRLGWDDVLRSPPTWAITTRDNREPSFGQEHGRRRGWRADLYNAGPAWTPDNRPRKIRATRFRHDLG